MLNALSTSISNIVSLFLQTLRFSALLPALCFVALNQFVLPQVLGLDLKSCKALEFFQQPAWTVLLTIVIGYTLSALNIPVIRFFEGYPYRHTWWGAWLTEYQIGVKRILEQRISFYSELYQMSKDILTDKYTEEDLKKTKFHFLMQAEFSNVYSQLNNSFPERDAFVLPTALGNSIVAFEEYTPRHYGIDAIHLWPRLLPILSERQYSSFVEREKAALDFMLNTSLLMSIFALEGIIIELCGYTGIWLFFASVPVAYLFYRGAIASALNWGETVKVAFDSYRYELANRLSLRPVWSMSEEKDQWERLSNFIRNPIQDYVDYDYPLPRRTKPEG